MVRKENKSKDPIQNALETFEITTKSPADYLKEQKEYAETNRLLLKSLFDYAKSSSPHFQSTNCSTEIIVEQMDEEQIWQQLEEQNDLFFEKCMTETCRLLSLNESKLKLKVNYFGEEKVEEKECTNENGHDSARKNDVQIDSERSGEEEESDDQDYKDNDDDDEDDEEEEAYSDIANKNALEAKAFKKSLSSVVDDQFFNMSEMEAFLDSEDKKELDRLNGKSSQQDDENSDEEIDYFDSLSDDEDGDNEGESGRKGKNLMFADFFDTEDQLLESAEQIKQRRRAEREAKNIRKKEEMKKDLGLDDSDVEENSETEKKLFYQDGDDYSDEKEKSDGDVEEKSEYDLRQQRLKKRIKELEENALADKPWQLKGEITSSTRPKNSLLEEVLEFDSVVRPPPLITEETTLCLEDIIKRRIKSKAWDDVERKIKPINDQQNYRKNLVLPQEKSKESLTQIYEKEYLEKVHKLNNVNNDTKPDEPREHTEIRTSLKHLFTKLDALSNFHFTSKPVAVEAKIITNIPAIEMEEVAPVAVSDATLLAPEEIRARPVGNEIGRSERTGTDKKRERRKKKIKQKLQKQREEKYIEDKEKQNINVTSKEKQKQILNQVTKNRNVIKGSTKDENKALKSSKTFFTQLQENISSSIKSKSLGKKKSTSNFAKDELNAKRFKL